MKKGRQARHRIPKNSCYSFGASLNPIALRMAKMAFLSAIGLKRRLFTLTNLFSLGLLLKATLPVLVLLPFPLGVRFFFFFVKKKGNAVRKADSFHCDYTPLNRVFSYMKAHIKSLKLPSFFEKMEDYHFTLM